MLASNVRIALAAVATAIVGVAHAGPETVTIVARPAAALRGLNPSEGEAWVGTYRMSDGRDMVLKQRGRVLVADLEGVPQTRLWVGDGGNLQSADDSMRLHFDIDPKTDARDVIVSLRMADASQMALAPLKAARR